jgi:hypothetical protein
MLFLISFNKKGQFTQTGGSKGEALESFQGGPGGNRNPHGELNSTPKVGHEIKLSVQLKGVHFHAKRKDI